jgi:acyl-coenzyme A thioesterase PaaI-like protein
VKGLGLRWLPLVPREETGRPSRTLAAAFDPDPEWAGVPGYLHGGMAAAVLDECLGALSHALDDLPCMTGTLDLRYRKPVPLDGSTLRIETWREQDEPRRRCRAHGVLLLADGTAAVTASALMIAVPSSLGTV